MILSPRGLAVFVFPEKEEKKKRVSEQLSDIKSTVAPPTTNY